MLKSRLLISLAVAALIATCTSGHHHRSMGAKTSADIKVHAIDATTDQEVVELQARSGGQGSPIHWKTDDPAAMLNIEFDRGQQCVVDLKCNKNDCTAKTNADYHGGAPLRCHYRTSVGAVMHDPVVIVDDCCP